MISKGLVLLIHMDDSDDLDDSELIIEQGEIYDHATHGQVEVQGLWRGVERVDQTQNSTDGDTFIVNYASKTKGEWDISRTSTLREFIQAIE